MFRLEKTPDCAGGLAAVEQPTVGVFFVEAVDDDDGSHGLILSLAVIPSFYAATRTVKNFLLGVAFCAVRPCRKPPLPKHLYGFLPLKL